MMLCSGTAQPLALHQCCSHPCSWDPGSWREQGCSGGCRPQGCLSSPRTPREWLGVPRPALCVPLPAPGTALCALGLPSLPQFPHLFSPARAFGKTWCPDSNASKDNNWVCGQTGTGQVRSLDTGDSSPCRGSWGTRMPTSPFGRKHPRQGRCPGLGGTEELLVPP